MLKLIWIEVLYSIPLYTLYMLMSMNHLPYSVIFILHIKINRTVQHIDFRQEVHCK